MSEDPDGRDGEREGREPRDGGGAPGAGDAGGGFSSRQRIVAIALDERSVLRRAPDVEHERAVAIYDLVEDNRFGLPGRDAGPYRLTLGVQDNRRLVFDIRSEDDAPVAEVMLPLLPLRRVIKDYFTVCESYFEAIRTATPSRIEAIDMGRRGLHNEGSELLLDALRGQVETDFQTARRLFTLVCVLHMRG